MLATTRQSYSRAAQYHTNVCAWEPIIFTRCTIPHKRMCVGARRTGKSRKTVEPWNRRAVVPEDFACSWELDRKLVGLILLPSSFFLLRGLELLLGYLGRLGHLLHPGPVVCVCVCVVLYLGAGGPSVECVCAPCMYAHSPYDGSTVRLFASHGAGCLPCKSLI